MSAPTARGAMSGDLHLDIPAELAHLATACAVCGKPYESHRGDRMELLALQMAGAIPLVEDIKRRAPKRLADMVGWYCDDPGCTLHPFRDSGEPRAASPGPGLETLHGYCENGRAGIAGPIPVHGRSVPPMPKGAREFVMCSDPSCPDYGVHESRPEERVFPPKTPSGAVRAQPRRKSRAARARRRGR
jgi:hypothetical protein